AQCCDDAANACRSAPGANQAECSSDRATCYQSVGLKSPYGKRAETCVSKQNTCLSSGDPNISECSADAAQCCDDAANACRSAPGANQAECSSDRATCYQSVGLKSPYGKRAETCVSKQNTC
ncbi:hypothetical protein VP1G_11517, partial [Cytospora mali]